jgi:excinuclease ABC subunit B
MHEIHLRIERNERVLVTTLTKRMAEELSSYLSNMGVKTRYIHSDVETLDRIQILEDLRKGEFDVLVGINLLREGLDLPEVSLVAILDADKEGFLRSERSLTQTAGRAARNLNGMVIMYADKITNSMKRTIDSTNQRREKQMKYNIENDITPTQIIKASREIVGYASIGMKVKGYSGDEPTNLAADPVVQYMSVPALEKAISKLKKDMEASAKELDFYEAARLRDEMFRYQEILKSKN